jgi:PAS domain S-box-containing protein
MQATAEAEMSADRADQTVECGDRPDGDAGGRRYEEMLEFTTDGHLVTDGQGVVLEANSTAAAVLRCPREFLVGKPLGLFVTAGHRARFYESLTRLHAGAPRDEFETRLGRRAGEPRVAAVWVSALAEGAGDRPSFRWVIRDITERRRAEAAREDLLRRLVHAQEDERRRVARELHDSVGQLLTAMFLGIRAVKDAGPLHPAALERLEDVQRLADELGRATHDLAVRLRPTALDDVGLDVALRHYLEEWSARTRIEVQYQPVGLGGPRLNPEVETAIYRVIQEALTNVARHAQARLVSVVVERQDGRAVAIVEDNGIGFDPEAATDRLGLIGMRERAALVGGRFEVESSRGGGTSVIVQIPL